MSPEGGPEGEHRSAQREGGPASPHAAAAAVRVRAWFVRLAVAAAALMLVVIVASAFMRHSQSGLGCPDWPACYGRADAEAVAAPPLPVRFARLAHRLAASGVLVAVAGLLLVAWTQVPQWTGVRALAALALALALGLAALGVATPGSRVPAVALGNLVGGLAVLALLAATAEAARTPRADAGAGGHRLRIAAGLLLALAIANAMQGGAIGATFALAQCPAPGDCLAALPDAIAGVRGFDPFRPLAVVAGRVASPDAAAGLCALHAPAGVVVSVAVLALAHALRRRHRALAWVLAVVATATAVTGALALVHVPSLALALLHNGGAALLLALLAAVFVRSRRAAPPRASTTS